MAVRWFVRDRADGKWWAGQMAGLRSEKDRKSEVMERPENELAGRMRERFLQ